MLRGALRCSFVTTRFHSVSKVQSRNPRARGALMLPSRARRGAARAAAGARQAGRGVLSPADRLRRRGRRGGVCGREPDALRGTQAHLGREAPNLHVILSGSSSQNHSSSERMTWQPQRMTCWAIPARARGKGRDGKATSSRRLRGCTATMSPGAYDSPESPSSSSKCRTSRSPPARAARAVSHRTGARLPSCCRRRPPPPHSRTNWTRLVPPSVLSGHASSLLPY